jgi:tetratricopeptide (TPR) repeat protein
MKSKSKLKEDSGQTSLDKSLNKNSILLQEALNNFRADCRLSLASELAICGKLSQAERLLVKGDRYPRRLKDLDLLAKIYIKKGQYAIAHQIWTESLKISDEPEQINEKLKALEGYSKEMYAIRNAVSFSIIIIIGVTLILYLYTSSYWK